MLPITTFPDKGVQIRFVSSIYDPIRYYLKKEGKVYATYNLPKFPLPDILKVYLNNVLIGSGKYYYNGKSWKCLLVFRWGPPDFTKYIEPINPPRLDYIDYVYPVQDSVAGYIPTELFQETGNTLTAIGYSKTNIGSGYISNFDVELHSKKTDSLIEWTPNSLYAATNNQTKGHSPPVLIFDFPFVVEPPAVEPAPEPLEPAPEPPLSNNFENVYFKYTSGESYTLNGNDYYGFLHVNENGEVYTGKNYTDDSELLTTKSTFFSDIIRNKIELNTAYKNIEYPVSYVSNVFDNLNKEGLISLTNTIDTNNLIVFKNLIVDNPTIYNFNPKYDYFYGIPDSPNTSYDSLSVISTDVPVKNFDYVSAFRNLNNAIAAELVVDNNENYKYILSLGDNLFLLQGKFNEPVPLEIKPLINFTTDDLSTIDFTHNVVYESEIDRLFLVNTGFINIYDTSNLNDCDNLVLIDKIKLPNGYLIERNIWNILHRQYNGNKIKWGDRYKITDDNNPQYIKFGGNLRTGIYDNILYLYNKFSNIVCKTIDLAPYNMGELIDIDIRSTDDTVLILFKNNNNLYVLCINPNNTENSSVSLIESIGKDYPWYKIKFSKIDSDIFYISTPKEYQTRHISYMTYPTGRLEFGNLLYRKDYIWSEVEEYYNDIDINWNHGYDLANSYTNILTSEQVANNKMYMLLHNNSRIYVMSQPLPSRYDNNISQDIPKSFTGVDCSETSAGLYFNNTISNINKDTLNLYNQSYGIYSMDEFNLTVSSIPNIPYSSNNLYINGNETFNVLVLRRITSLIKDIQTKLTANSISWDDAIE